MPAGEPRPPEPHLAIPSDRLDSWKEIAAHLARSVPTVQRWEKKEGLPVHRHTHESQASVYAYRSELDGWWRTRSPGSFPAGIREKRARHRGDTAHDRALEAAASDPAGPAARDDRLASPGVAAEPKRRREMAVLPGLAAVVLAAGGIYLGWTRSPGPSPEEAITSVAVLPFENAGGDPDSQYLSDGLAESLIDELARLPGLRVIARSASFRFRGEDVDPRQVGRDLGVGAVVSGRVSLRGDTLAIRAELVDVIAGTQLWSEHYNTSMENIFVAQGDIAREISRGLRLRLAPPDEAALTRRQAANPEAHRRYLLSRFEHNKRTHEGFRKALDYARQATRDDPSYAPAYAAMADAYASLGDSAQLSNRDANSRARAAAMKALAIDESLPEAHRILAWVHFYLDWDWAGADREFERAIGLNPNSAEAQSRYSFYLVAMGRLEDGIAHARRAVELDPLTPWLRGGIGWALYFAREYDQALEAYRGALEFDPDLGFHFWLGNIYREKSMHEDAIAEYRRYIDRYPDEVFALGHLGNTYARAGRARDAREILREIKGQLRDDKVGLYEVAFIYAGLGEKDRAFEWLEKAYAARDQGLAYMRVDPALDPLRSDPRFEDLLRRMNLPYLGGAPRRFAGTNTEPRS